MSNVNPPMDLATPKGIVAFLESTDFASVVAIPITGGYGNYVFRVALKKPYQGRETLVVKHGKPYIPGNENFKFAVERQAYEVAAMKHVHTWLSQLDHFSVVTVPAIHLYDATANVIIMDDCGAYTKTLKQSTLDGLPSLEVAQQIGTALGDFLARLHSWGSADQEGLKYFDGNQQARSLSAWATYGRLVSTLKGEDEGIASLKSPTLDVSADQLQTIGELAKQTTEEMMKTYETLVMGDFWPGNFLLDFSPDGEAIKRIYIVDWELVRPGIAGLDVGQFLAEMHLLRRFHPHCAESSSAVISAFQKAYASTRGDVPQEVARKAMVHVGAHLVAWTPRIDRGTREKTREVVHEGVEYLLSGSGAERQDTTWQAFGNTV
ncbi:hypothetical protein EIP91_011543 [Steccherinum ochraceum]|uniref:Aminoglycoside phosphotransferase domain-containing protein n=1 Tax=Steccherinum ochraceum TaxID=92696 RepID=A0A4R0RHT0_9APHY|nr:hypothetical protein EIP91_011543 [Steccherinum ochraceum]